MMCACSGHGVTDVSSVPDNASDPWILGAGLSGDDGPRPMLTVLHQTAPLDAQFGSWPKKSVPDMLREPVFGGPWLHSFALIDAARIPDLAARLDEHGLPAACLFDGEAGDKAAGSAPWLIEIGPDDRLTRQLFTRAEDGKALWDSGAFVLLRSDLPLAAIRANLRRMTQIRDEGDEGDDGKWLFFRFWDPLYARYLLSYGSDQMRQRLLRTGPMMLRGAAQDDFQIWSLPAPPPDDAPRHAFRLRPEDHHALKLARLDDFVRRVLVWLQQSYGPLPAGTDAWRFVLELALHARDRLGLETERCVSDYVAASWLLRMPAERRLDMRPVGHEILQATMERLHDTAYAIFTLGNDKTG